MECWNKNDSGRNDKIDRAIATTATDGGRRDTSVDPESDGRTTVAKMRTVTSEIDLAMEEATSAENTEMTLGVTIRASRNVLRTLAANRTDQLLKISLSTAGTNRHQPRPLVRQGLRLMGPLGRVAKHAPHPKSCSITSRLRNNPTSLRTSRIGPWQTRTTTEMSVRPSRTMNRPQKSATELRSRG